jgi:dihydroorotase
MAHFGRLTDTPASFVLTGARVVDPASGTDAEDDLAVVRGVIVPSSEAPADVRRIAADGLIAAPGLCDLNAHLAPDLDDVEAVEDVARSAARGGYTTVCIQPDDVRPLDTSIAVAQLQAMDAATRLRCVASLTRGATSEQLAELGALAEAGAVAAVAGRGCSAALIRAGLRYLAPLGLPLMVRAEEPSLAAGALMGSGHVAMRLGLGGRPSSAELVAVEGALAIADEVAGRIHFSSISTQVALDAIRRARGRGTAATCDVTPHHVALHDGWIAGDRRFAWDAEASLAFDEPLDPQLAYDANCRLDPPLPLTGDARALLAGIVDGAVGVIATDHRPLPPQHKQVEVAAAAPGMIGLEAALSLGLAAVEAGCIELAELLEALSTKPAQLIGEPRGLGIGQTADLVVFDPESAWGVEREALASVHANTPLLGRRLPGIVRLTVADGRITYDDLD